MGSSLAGRPENRSWAKLWMKKLNLVATLPRLDSMSLEGWTDNPQLKVYKGCVLPARLEIMRWGEHLCLLHLVKKMVASASVLWGCRASNTYFKSWEPLNSGRPEDVICRRNITITSISNQHLLPVKQQINSDSDNDFYHVWHFTEQTIEQTSSLMQRGSLKLMFNFYLKLLVQL